jgi:hypothetical protein
MGQLIDNNNLLHWGSQDIVENVLFQLYWRGQGHSVLTSNRPASHHWLSIQTRQLTCTCCPMQSAWPRPLKFNAVMDQLMNNNNLLHWGSWEIFENGISNYIGGPRSFSIRPTANNQTRQVAMKLAHKKINHYYLLTDLSSAYWIAMGE